MVKFYRLLLCLLCFFALTAGTAGAGTDLTPVFADETEGDSSETESVILQYSKQNDKKWLFVEDIEPVIKDCQSTLVECRKLKTEWITDRMSLAYLTGLTKLYNAEMTGDISILETTTIAKDDLHLNLSALVIRKDKIMLDKNNLFKI